MVDSATIDGGVDKENRAFADLRLEEKDSISPSTPICAAIKG